jgi:hypothetical protein
MSQDQQQLRDTLARLHAELEQTDALDDNTRNTLQHLMRDIQALLEREGQETAEESAGRYNSLTGRLRAAVAEFEASHPNLTASMERAIDALVQMGV